MQKTCNRESYVLSPSKKTVLNPVLFFSLQSKTNQKINTLKSSILKSENVGNDYALQKHDQPPVLYIKTHWKLVLCILLSPMINAFNLLLCLLKAIKVIAISCIMIIAVFHSLCLSAQTPRKDSGVNGQVKYELVGQVLSAIDNSPMQGVSIRIDAEKIQVKSSKDGTFKMLVNNRNGKIKFSFVGFKSQEINYTSGVSLTVKLIPEDNKLEEVEVVSTGYQKIPKERATGSFEFVDNKLLNRKVSMDFLSRLEDVVPSVSRIKLYEDSRGKLPFVNIRGTSSINSNIWPLIVLDGVPYQGDFNTINPNDIENVTILKDAAASSIWGAQSGNGVIVVTTKKGAYEKPIQVSFNSNLTIRNKPDLYYYPQMATSDYIDVEQMLFENGYYDGKMYDFQTNITPVVQLLKKNKEGKLSLVEMNRELDRLRKIDFRDDLLKYIYRKETSQQYNVQVEGGGKILNSIFSIGYDRSFKNIVNTDNSRLTTRSYTMYRPTSNLDIGLNMQYSEYGTKEPLIRLGFYDFAGGYGNFPYMELADANGNPLIVDAIALHPEFRDTVAGGRLLDWKYRPLAELDQTSVTSKQREVQLTFDAAYKITPSLRLSLLYNYRNQSSNVDSWRGIGSIAQREAINYFASWDQNSVKWNVPVGDYLMKIDNINNSQQGRLQMDFNRVWQGKHALSFLVGAEVRQQNQESYNTELWGYDSETLTSMPVDYVNDYPYLNGIYGIRKIDNNFNIVNILNRFTSYFINGSYTLANKYIVSGSARKDASNLFGVKTNNRGKPFWSIGASWILSNEKFIGNDLFSFLKLRATYGHNGNVNNSNSAYPIIYRSSQPHHLTGLPYATMQSPPNPSLRWETVGMLNFGVDFQLHNNRISGALEYYVKKPKDLIASTLVDPTSGFNSMSMNSANLLGKGVDLSLNTVNLKSRSFEWINNLVFAYSRTKVTKSYVPNQLGKNFRASPFSSSVTPLVDADLNSVITYKWAGLDPQTGMPRGYFNGELSTDYAQIYNNTKIVDMDNHGSALPLYFGSLRNLFRFKDLDLSFNISYQLGHKFMRRGTNYSFLIDQRVGNNDFARRWQKPGDEKVTDVPVFNYPSDYYGDYFYNYSSALVLPADQIKLRDIQFGYSPQLPARIKLKDLRFYTYLTNITTIWRANKMGIDPEYGISTPDPFTCSFGVRFKL
ncbi:SusC/RagA family TonB-linked outer membrane protein [Sphingobacterium sp. UDSM-2020]|uniref:SusC/RagA family TonB-linked outer membrane protein n=1 Tax=Sphingobacterium sp. UDSM-2020 TaxID=2795738 RepID=UPI001934C736|nr:SusC/RagA family TonB-linked outer membrane protein [Sphingobacterium sp. UDSM-2020]QQD14263.1 SusC/RagA family TonB-linked outer membrane protein [Sphingobacterium sp. UDSM-2020]